MKKMDPRIKKLIAALSAIVLTLSLCSCSQIISKIVPDFVSFYFTEPTEEDIYEKSLSADESVWETEEPTETTAPPSDNTEGEEDTQGAPPPAETGTVIDGEINYVNLINTISTDTIKACVNITTSEYTSAYSNTPISSSLGSGIIFYGETISGGYRYYVLTNYHVVELSTTCVYYRYEIEDYQGVTVSATRPQFSGTVSEDLYTLNDFCQRRDLAVLQFDTVQELKIIPMANSNMAVGETVISIGQPSGQKNTITIGTIDSYGPVTLSDGFTPNFDVIAHTAPIDHGNSGGAILNAELELVGVNFAGAYNDDGSFAYGYGIPIETVWSFLKSYGFTTT